jgi:hypothetical protein
MEGYFVVREGQGACCRPVAVVVAVNVNVWTSCTSTMG